MIILVYSSGNRLNESEKFILQILGKKMHINQIVPFKSDYCFCLSNEKAWHELISSYRALRYPGSSCPDKKTDAQMVSGSIQPVFKKTEHNPRSKPLLKEFGPVLGRPKPSPNRMFNNSFSDSCT